MNRRLEGWRLGIAVLLPALILAAAIWFLLQALSGDDNTALDTSNLVPTSTPVPTVAQQSAAVVSPTPVPSPTPLALPTPVPLPSAEPTEVAAEPTAVPTTAPAPTSAPSQPSQPSQPAGPTPTPTVDASILVVTCSGATFPISVGVNEAIPQLEASVTPAEAVSNLQFLWNFGNNTVAGARNSGSVMYSAEGTYTVTLAATDRTSQQVTNVTCGTVNVGTSSGGGSSNAPLTVSCQVRPANANIEWEDATLADQMRVTVSWTPNDTVLNLQYEFPIPEPIIFSNEASSGDNQTYRFPNRSSVAKIFWRNQATGDTGRTSCEAFTDPPSTYNQP